MKTHFAGKKCLLFDFKKHFKEQLFGWITIEIVAFIWKNYFLIFNTISDNLKYDMTLGMRLPYFKFEDNSKYEDNLTW